MRRLKSLEIIKTINQQGTHEIRNWSTKYYIILVSMQKIFTTFLFSFVMATASSQSQRKVSVYLETQYNYTLYDYTANNNPWGIGLGLQCNFNNQSNFKPTFELTGDLYLEDDKVLRLNPDGSMPKSGSDVRDMVNLFAGTSFHPNKHLFISFLAGPSFIGKQTLVGIKPSFGFYFSKNQRWTGKVSYINVFNRTKIVREDFGSVSLAVGFKLF